MFSLLIGLWDVCAKYSDRCGLDCPSVTLWYDFNRKRHTVTLFSYKWYWNNWGVNVGKVGPMMGARLLDLDQRHKYMYGSGIWSWGRDISQTVHVVVSTIHTHPANLCQYQSTMLIYFYAHFVAGKCCLTTIIPTLDSSKPRSQRSRLRPGPHLCSLETKTTYLGGAYQACTKHHLYSVSNFWKTAFGAEKCQEILFW